MTGDTRKWLQWDFSSLEDWEVEHCWAYELTRLVPGLVRLVRAWRRKVPKRKEQKRFDAYRVHQGGRVTPVIQIDDNRFFIPLGAYYLFPEWPSKPYLKIPSRVRFQRLKKLSEYETGWLEPREVGLPEGPTGRRKLQKEGDTGRKGKATGELREIEPHPAQYGLDPVHRFKTKEQAFRRQWDEDAWDRFIESLRKNILGSKNDLWSSKMRAFRSDSEELAILRIDWTLSGNQLLASFSKWLARNRPVPFQKQGRLGRSHPLAKKRTELEYLRKYLIVEEAGTWKVTAGGGPLFRDHSKWNACHKRVEKVLADLGSYPGCTS